MKALTKITLTTLATLFAAVPAFAASAGQADHSSFPVWAFLSLCALIIVAQVGPALLGMLGIGKTVASPKK